MKRFENYHSVAVFWYFLSVTAVTMFCMDPILLLLSLFGAVLLWAKIGGKQGFRGTWKILILFVVLSLLNPLFSHSGDTVLFYLNNNAMTLEALIYGITAATALTAVILWFCSFSRMMTSDRLLCVFGSLSPKTALVFSMALRALPMISGQLKRTKSAQKGIGLYRDDDLALSIRSRARVFSIVSTWALENGITTADSMEARGYGTQKRTFFRHEKFRAGDLRLLLFALLSAAFVLICLGFGKVGFDFYPTVSARSFSGVSAVSYLLFGGLCFLATFFY